MENTLKVRRVQLDLIQLQVIRRLARGGLTMSPSRYSVIENGHVDPTAAERRALAKALETTEDVLFPGADQLQDDSAATQPAVGQ